MYLKCKYIHFFSKRKLKKFDIRCFKKKDTYFYKNTCMKAKLSLTVRKSVIDTAKRYSRKTGKSISQMFEDFFEKTETKSIKSEQLRSAKRLLKTLERSNSVESLDDKFFLRDHVAQKVVWCFLDVDLPYP